MSAEDPGGDRLHPEQRARVRIDQMLEAAGWVVQDYRRVNLYEDRGVAVRELMTDAGPADYVLFVDRQVVGVIEAKKEGTPLAGVEWQTVKYQANVPEEIPSMQVDGRLPFGYESTGAETWFTCRFDPEPTARQVYWVHRPETLADWMADRVQHGRGSLRARLLDLPEVEPDPGRLRSAQYEAIKNLEVSLKDGRQRALIQMATGSGKTYCAANIAHRLIEKAGAQRVLFLVDRANLGLQTLKEFQGFEVPGAGRKLTEIYNVQHLTSSRLDPVASVCIATIQRVYSMLRGEDMDESLDEASGFEAEPQRTVEVDYQPALPIEAFDVVIVDECHRSIYGVWRQVLEYFDAHLIGLTATPGKQTFGFFHGNMVMEYGFPQAVADNVNVDFDVFRISTEVTEHGGEIEAGFLTRFRDRETRQERFEEIDEELPYEAGELDRKVQTPDQIRTVLRAYRDNLPQMFPDRDVDDRGRLVNIPKTLIFAKDDNHAEEIVRVAREELGKGNDVIAKITYKASDGAKPEDLLSAFRTGYNPRIAVTVDMIATGTDVKPLEVVVFLRMVRSRSFFEQMKGRGVRVIGDDELRAVTGDATHKDRFVLVDAVGVTETELMDTVPLERKKGVGLEKLLNQVRLGQRDEDTVSTLASRLARLNSRIGAAQRSRLEAVAERPLQEIAEGLAAALDPDSWRAAAAAATAEDEPTPNAVVLLSTVRTYQRKTGYVDDRLDGAVASTGFCVLRPTGRVRPRFLFHRVRADDVVERLNSLQTGSSYPAVRAKDVLSQRIGVPPLEEQDRIVAAIEGHLSRLDAATASLASAEAKAAALERKATSELFDRDDWAWAVLGDVAEVKGGITKDTKRQGDPAFVSVPYLRVANVQRGHLDLSEVTEIRAAPEKVEALRLQPGDVLFNEGGDRDKLGRGWVWEGQIDPCIHQNHVFRARLSNGVLDPYFLSTHANTWGRAWFEEHGRQTTNLASISLTMLKKLPVPLPPITEQRAVMGEVRRTSQGAAGVITAVGLAIRHIDALRRSILAAAFSGRLVPS